MLNQINYTINII